MSFLILMLGVGGLRVWLLPGRKALIPAKGAVAAAEAGDFHWHIARADRERRLQGSTGFPRHWRWRVRALQPQQIMPMLMHLTAHHWILACVTGSQHNAVGV